MNFPENKKIILLNIPNTYINVSLCPLNQTPITFLKMVSWLEKLKNRVVAIDMHDDNSWVWKKKKGGIDNSFEFEVKVYGRDYNYLARRLKEVDFIPDEIWISSMFSFDLDLVREFIDVIRKRFKEVKIVIGGDGVRYLGDKEAKDVFKEINDILIYRERIKDVYYNKPKWEVKEDWEYGLFQLQTGCVNKCSFCLIGKDSPFTFSPREVISYLKEFYKRYRPHILWNWDPNPLLFYRVFDEFFDLYLSSKIQSILAFGKGFQPDLVRDELMKKISLIGAHNITIPVELATTDIKNISKPYTVISSIKAFDIAKRYGISKQIKSTFLFGYPDDNFKAIFRSFLVSIFMDTSPTPFPVYFFPQSLDYFRYSALLKKKDITDLHGELFPLICGKDVGVYKNLLEFFMISDIKKILNNIYLLTPQLRDIFMRELEVCGKFINLARSVEKDSIENLKKIEKEIYMKKLTKFKNLLYISANPKPVERSVSKQFGEYFISEYLKIVPTSFVKRVDLCKENIDFINEEYIDYVYHRKDFNDVSMKTKKLIRLGEKYITEIEKSDIILLTVQMWTWSIPSILKCYLEIISSMLIFRKKSKFKSKKVICILTREGDYPQETDQEKTIKTIMKEMGLSDNVEFIIIDRIDPLNPYGRINADEIKKKIVKIIKDLG